MESSAEKGSEAAFRLKKKKKFHNWWAKSNMIIRIGTISHMPQNKNKRYKKRSQCMIQVKSMWLIKKILLKKKFKVISWTWLKHLAEWFEVSVKRRKPWTRDQLVKEGKDYKKRQLRQKMSQHRKSVQMTHGQIFKDRGRRRRTGSTCWDCSWLTSMGSWLNCVTRPSTAVAIPIRATTFCGLAIAAWNISHPPRLDPTSI